MAGQRHPSVCRVADARPGIPGELPAAPLVRYGWTPRGELAVVMTVVANRCAALITMINTGADGGAPSHGPAGNPLPLRQRRRVTEQLNPAGLSYTYQYEKDASPSPTAWTAVKCCTRRAKRAEAGGEKGTRGRQRHAESVDAVGRLRAQTDAAGRTTEYSRMW